MKKFTQAIVKRPCRNMIHGLTSAGLGIPDFQKALVQHDGYIEALKQCGLEVTILDADERFPDSVFIEDIALLTPECAIIMLPGAPSRMAETDGMESVLKRFYTNIESIQPPGNIEAGDIMMVGPHFYIGLSERTNQAGATQLISILKRYGLTGSLVKLKKLLHLKTGVSYLEENNLLVSDAFFNDPEFTNFDKIMVDDDEAYAANSVWINGKVLVPKGFPKTTRKIQNRGFDVISLDVSEFQKLDGGLSCLSLRF
ncbi:MAG: N(G),N(G)-dimethylarginine dimethylaminohydrolase [Bacteroidetes bacterium]|nr:N(G),N(G)-dimethylarginine dimethylaminohydrolase [Bacteroidota bacterium]